ncbi:MAG: SDR family NAD(P)-dependent oxidoreductase [Bacteroidales bacterium]|nr:SDR family NAD(P)-dependent oxidoreductase [Bacteroidales bacterium]
MARIFITGSADGLGQLAAKKLVDEGHQLVLHARNTQRGEYAMNKVPGAENVLVADLSDLEETKRLAAEVNALGTFDAIIHNAGVYHAPGEMILAVNTIAPYVLTCLIPPPKRLIYLSSGLQLQGTLNLKSLDAGHIAYSDSKAWVTLLAMVVARKWPEVYSNAVDPGWVPTKMGGAGATDDLQKGYETQVWLAVSDEAKISGRYFYHQKERPYLNEAGGTALQDLFLEKCEAITGIHFPLDKEP